MSTTPVSTPVFYFKQTSGLQYGATSSVSNLLYSASSVYTKMVMFLDGDITKKYLIRFITDYFFSLIALLYGVSSPNFSIKEILDKH